MLPQQNFYHHKKQSISIETKLNLSNEKYLFKACR